MTHRSPENHWFAARTRVQGHVLAALHSRAQLKKPELPAYYDACVELRRACDAARTMWITARNHAKGEAFLLACEQEARFKTLKREADELRHVRHDRPDSEVWTRLEEIAAECINSADFDPTIFRGYAAEWPGLRVKLVRATRDAVQDLLS